MPAPWSNATKEELGQIRGVCLDIDDTLSTHGKLTSEAFSALWKLKETGFAVVAITGRPAGWCDHFARFWPVDAVVGENGAFTFFMKSGVRRRIDTPAVGIDSDPITRKKRLENLGAAIRSRFPHAKWASDQAYREYDLAIDFCEDVPRWPAADLDTLLDLCVKEGAHAKLSSIHVNVWFGDYDKHGGFTHWLNSEAPVALQDPSKWLFIGDSPNDEPLFARFASSVGVANLKPFLSRIAQPPRWLTDSESGAGVREMVDRLVHAKTGAW